VYEAHELTFNVGLSVGDDEGLRVGDTEGE